MALQVPQSNGMTGWSSQFTQKLSPAQSLVTLFQLKLDLKQVFDLVGYQFSLIEGKVRSTLEHWQTLNANPETSLQTHMPGPAADASRRVTDGHRRSKST